MAASPGEVVHRVCPLPTRAVEMQETDLLSKQENEWIAKGDSDTASPPCSLQCELAAPLCGWSLVLPVSGRLYDRFHQLGSGERS